MSDDNLSILFAIELHGHGDSNDQWTVRSDSRWHLKDLCKHNSYYMTHSWYSQRILLLNRPLTMLLGAQGRSSGSTGRTGIFINSIGSQRRFSEYRTISSHQYNFCTGGRTLLQQRAKKLDMTRHAAVNDMSSSASDMGRPQMMYRRCVVWGKEKAKNVVGALRQVASFASRGKDVEDSEEDVPWLIVGLGNPGVKYAGHRHNVGFMAVDDIAKAHGVTMDRLQKNCHVGRGYILESKVLLAKPMTFMNNSGEGVSKLMQYYKIPLDRLIVLYDDLDTKIGVVRLRQKGGHGGQNGMRSIIDKVGSNEFARVKIGIGRPREGMDVVGHVLSNFGDRDGEQKEDMEQILKIAGDTVRALLSLGVDKASSGVRVDVNGDVIKVAHSNGKKKRKAEETETRPELVQTPS